MKKKIIMALTVVFALCLAVTVFAFNQSNVSTKTSADCCDKKDDCPMKNKSATTDKKDCCDKADDCPMKKQNAEKQTTNIDMTNVTVAGSSENCCQPGADCCKGGSCCKGKHS
jgi:hypothetical protein